LYELYNFKVDEQVNQKLIEETVGADSLLETKEQAIKSQESVEDIENLMKKFEKILEKGF
jgi:hypothetical protein